MSTITFKARDYQAQAIKHLLQKPMSGLFMDPGTGKTACVLAAYHILKKKGMVDKLLIVAPLNPIYNTWPDEIEKWGFPYNWTILHGYKKEQRLGEDVDIYLINYEGIPWLARQKEWEFDWLCLDESSKVKNTRSGRFKSLKHLLPRFKRRTILTGTPSPNGLLDLFGQIYCLDQGASLGRYITHYRLEFFYQTGYGGYTYLLQPGAEKKIQERLKPLIARFDESVLDLPKKVDVPVYMTMPKDVMTRYRKFEADFVMQVEQGLVTASNAAVLTQKLRQVANGGIYIEGRKAEDFHFEKVKAIQDLSEELDGKPLLIGYEFAQEKNRLLDTLGDVPVISGGVKHHERRKIFKEFNQGKHPFLIGQLASMALGLNLQEACHHVVLHSLPWDLEVYIQFIRRVYRSGQKHRTYVHHLIMRDTIDEIMMRVLRRKNQSQTALLNALKTQLRRRK